MLPKIKVSVLLWLTLIGSAIAVPANRHLPFMAGETWWCSQDWYVNEDPYTHRYEPAWDFNWGSVSADLGKPLLAPSGGRIEYAGNTGSGFGNVVLIRYSDGSYDRIAHCQSIAVKKGEMVYQGQLVAWCGGSGGYPVHVHINAQTVSNPSVINTNTYRPCVESSFYYRVGSSNFYGRPLGCSCNYDDGQHRYTSRNSNIIDREFNSNGGSGNFGSAVNDIHWSNGGWNPNDLYNSHGVPRRGYMRDYAGGSWSASAIVYDGLGGARRSYTVRCGFYYTWTGQGGPQSSLGMPITNEYSFGTNRSRQDCIYGYLRYIQGASPEIRVMTYPVCAPGWIGSWNRQFSYLFAMVYDRNGRYQVIGNATENVVPSWRGTQYYTQRFSSGSRGSGMIIYDPNNIVDNPAATNEAYYIYGRFYQYWTTVDAVGPWVLGAPTLDRTGSTQYFKYGRMVEQTMPDGHHRVRAYNLSGDVIWTSPEFSPKLAPEEIDELPSDFILSQNYPNPFNSQTVISYSLPEPSNVDLSVYNLLGQKIVTLVNENRPAGEHTVSWVAHKLPSGVYFYRLDTEFGSESRRMLLVK